MRSCLFRILACAVCWGLLADDYVYVPNQCSASGAVDSGLKLDSVFTLEAWVWPDDEYEENNFMGAYNSGDNDVVLSIRGARMSVFYRNFNSDNLYYADQRLSVRRWNHLAVTCDGSVLSMYVNGVLNGTAMRSTPDVILPAQVNLTLAGSKADSPFRGRISEARFWSVCRSAEEIAANMGRRLTGRESGLAGCWPMNEGEGGTFDNLVPNAPSAGCRSDGWLLQANVPVTPADNVFGADDNAVHRVGTVDSIIDTRLTPGPSRTFTIETWIRPDDITENYGENMILGVYQGGPDGDFLFKLQDGYPTVWIRGSQSASSMTPVAAGRWCHLACVCDGETITLYRNGVLDVSVRVADPPVFLEGVHLILGGSLSDANPFRGSLRETRFWRIARTPEEIAVYWATPLTGMEPGLVGCWPLNETEGCYARNLAAFGVDGYSPNPDHHLDAGNPFHAYEMGNSVYMSSADCGGLDTGLRLESSQFTLEGWVYPSDINAENVFMAQYLSDGANDLIFAIGEGGHPFVWMRNVPGVNRLESPNTVELGKWTHLCAVFDGIRFRLYVDGALNCQSEVIGTDSYSDVPAAVNFRIAGLYDWNNTGFRGGLGDLRCWNVARSAEEIAADCKKRLSGTEPGLLGYWPLDGGGDDLSVVESIAYPRVYRASRLGVWQKAFKGYPFFTFQGTRFFVR